jgi:hypothetical protein
MAANNVALRASIEAATLRNIADTFRPPDPSYKGVWKKYTAYVDAGRVQGVLELGLQYLTRDNVDKYFSDVVAYLHTVQPSTASRHVCALAFYAKSLEYTSTDAEVFDVRGTSNGVVQKSLHAQEARYAKHMLSRNGDPHANLPTDVLTEEEHQTILSYAYTSNMLGWKNFVLSWNVCTVSYIRNNSLRQLYLSDTRVDRCHGPEESGRNAICLTLILQPFAHKDNRTKPTKQKKKNAKRVVGFYRHKDFLRCGTSAVATNLWIRFHNNRDLHFRAPPRRGGERGHLIAEWRKIPLITGWSSSTVVTNCYNRVLDSCGVSWSKVSHMRTAGIEYASSRGELGREAIATMSKHTNGDKLETAYVTELFAPTMRVMAGFSQKDDYFVARSEVECPFTQEEMSTLAFPHIEEWREQYQSPMGDKTKAAYNFLYETLPFLARVVFEDGPYYLENFPDHEISRKLRDQLPAEYLRWVQGAKAEAANLVDLCKTNEMQSGDAASRAAFEHFASKLHCLT